MSKVTYQINQRSTNMMISEHALKNMINGVPASPNFPVAMPRIEQNTMRPEIYH